MVYCNRPYGDNANEITLGIFHIHQRDACCCLAGHMCQIVLIMFICICLFNFSHWTSLHSKQRQKVYTSKYICIDIFPMNMLFLYKETEILVIGNRRKEKKIENKDNSHVEMISLQSNSIVAPMSSNAHYR